MKFTIAILECVILITLLTDTSSTSASWLSSWFGSGSQPDFDGTPPLDYGECDWYDPTMGSDFQPQPPMPYQSNNPDAGYDFTGGQQDNYGSPGFGFVSGSRDRPSRYRSARQAYMSSYGEQYNADDLTAAHRTLPVGNYYTVINENNNRSVVVRIVDNRGLDVVGRIMTLSQAAFNQIADLDERTVPCFVQVR